VETATSRWGLATERVLRETHLGDKLPMSLVIPVTIDCFADGFLIGVSVGLSQKAGIVLAFANSMEMAFLGMAYASRIVKCTGSSEFMRVFAVFAPPLVMWGASAVGAALASVTDAYPTIRVAFVAFGVVALLSLVCNELIIEARNSGGENPMVPLCIFAAVYLVLMLEHVI
jgi:zinc transporter ZupT